MFVLPELPFASDSLEPHIDKRTMEIHHDRHHATYVDKLNAAVENTAFEDMTIEEILQDSEAMEDPAIRNNAGGHYNHSLFWNLLNAKGGGKPKGELVEMISDAFGSFEDFQEEFTKSALGRFGSGWVWLIVRADGQLAIVSTPNQDNPLMPDGEGEGTPILGLDVWEHAYYLHYQNRRADYVNAFWNIVDWSKVQELYEATKVE